MAELERVDFSRFVTEMEREGAELDPRPDIPNRIKEIRYRVENAKASLPRLRNFQVRMYVLADEALATGEACKEIGRRYLAAAVAAKRRIVIGEYKGISGI